MRAGWERFVAVKYSRAFCELAAYMQVCPLWEETFYGAVLNLRVEFWQALLPSPPSPDTPG